MFEKGEFGGTAVLLQFKISSHRSRPVQLIPARCRGQPSGQSEPHLTPKSSPRKRKSARASARNIATQITPLLDNFAGFYSSQMTSMYKQRQFGE